MGLAGDGHLHSCLTTTRYNARLFLARASTLVALRLASSLSDQLSAPSEERNLSAGELPSNRQTARLPMGRTASGAVHRDAWTAALLAGGLGHRARQFAPNTPKALLPIAGTPAVVRQLRWLATCGGVPPSEILVSTGHESQRVAAALPASVNGVRVRPVAALPRGTVAALQSVLSETATERLLVHNCDTLLGYPLQRLLSSWPDADLALMVLASSSNRAPNPQEVAIAGTKLCGMGKASNSLSPPPQQYAANTGMYLCNVTPLRAHMPRARRSAKLERYLVNLLARSGLAGATLIGDVRIVDFGTSAGWAILDTLEAAEFEALRVMGSDAQ